MGNDNGYGGAINGSIGINYTGNEAPPPPPPLSTLEELISNYSAEQAVTQGVIKRLAGCIFRFTSDEELGKIITQLEQAMPRTPGVVGSLYGVSATMHEQSKALEQLVNKLERIV